MKFSIVVNVFWKNFGCVMEAFFNRVTGIAIEVQL